MLSARKELIGSLLAYKIAPCVVETSPDAQTEILDSAILRDEDNAADYRCN